MQILGTDLNVRCYFKKIRPFTGKKYKSTESNIVRLIYGSDCMRFLGLMPSAAYRSV